MCFERKEFDKMFLCMGRKYLAPHKEKYNDEGTWLHDVIVEDYGDCLLIYGKEYKLYFFGIHRDWDDNFIYDEEMFDKVCPEALETFVTRFRKKEKTRIKMGWHHLKNVLPNECLFTIYGNFVILE